MAVGGRINSDALLARTEIDKAAGRSFTTAANPAQAKKLANAPIVSKITEYVVSQKGFLKTRGHCDGVTTLAIYILLSIVGP